MKDSKYRKSVIFGIIVLFIGANVIPLTAGLENRRDENLLINPNVRLKLETFLTDDWGFRKQITIDHTKVDGDLENFPILIHHTSSDFVDHAQPDGDDFVFVNSTNIIQYNHEIEYYNNTNGELIAWVNVTSLSSTEDTILWMYYGNYECSSQENVEGTWNTNYEGVWHLSETGTGTRYDSTSYGNDGNPEEYDGDEATTGQIDGADELDGLGDNINMGNTACDVTEEITISLWYRTNDPSDFDTSACLVSNIDIGPNRGYYFEFDEAHRLEIHIYEDGTREDVFVTTGTFVDNYWHYAVATYIADGASRPKIYVDGVEQSGSYGGGPLDYIGISPAYPLRIGSYVTGGNLPFNGTVDEVRISNIARSDDWISTSYNNQNDPESFVTVGEEIILELKTTFIIGRITNLNTEGDVITFEAVKIRCIQFVPFQFIQYGSSEQITISDQYMGIITPKLVFAVCKTSI